VTEPSIALGGTAAVSRPRFSGLAWRLAGIAVGIGTQIIFLWTVVQLFQFLRFGAERNEVTSLWVDAFLALAFAVPHSILLVPKVQSLLRQHIPSGWLGLVHCLATCLGLLVLFKFWSPASAVLWHFEGWTAAIVVAAFYLSWLAMFYSLYLTGLGYQTGLTQWLYWFRNVKPPPREFVVRGAYRWLRHPVYLSFLGLIWFTPTMTADHAVLTLIWTAYIFIGSVFKDRRLKHYIGQPYVEYAQRVAGYPWIGLGSLGRWPKE
jgi:hypothetical protein